MDIKTKSNNKTKKPIINKIIKTKPLEKVILKKTITVKSEEKLVSEKNMDVDFWRQMGIVSNDELNKLKVVLIGAGGIGSPTALALSKMGLKNIKIYDPDTIENHNIPNQFYKLADITYSKVQSLKNIIKEFSGYDIKICQKIYDGDLDGANSIVISAVDSMKSRTDIWSTVKKNLLINTFIDARMGAELCRIYTINPNNENECKYYESTLYSDEEAEELPCTERSIIYNVFMIASLISNQVKKVSKKEEIAKEIIMDLKTYTLLTTVEV